MPLRVNTGKSKSVGLPDDGSLEASCDIEIELDSSLFQANPDALHQHIQTVYVACARAVQDELARQSNEKNAVLEATRQ